MANVKCDLTNLVVLADTTGSHVSIQQQVKNSEHEFDCTNLMANKTNGTYTNGVPATCSNACINKTSATSTSNSLVNGNHSARIVYHRKLSSQSQKSLINSCQSHAQDKNVRTKTKHRASCATNVVTTSPSATHHKLNGSLFQRSTHCEVVKNGKFKDKKADLQFPRQFVTVTKKEIAEDGRVLSSKNEIQTCVLQPSLFENIPPTIYFGLDDEIIEKPSSKYASLLIWRLSSITPSLIRQTVLRSGFKFVKENSTSTRWIATWCKHLETKQYVNLNSNQKVNHFPGSFNFGRKDRLWRNINHLCVSHHEDAFHPRTYILPDDSKFLRRIWNANPELKMILKPPASARGLGIRVIHKFDQIPKESREKLAKGANVSYIAQNYIEKPLLLFNQTKFDIRLYVLITSFDPLKFYLYDDGLIRFASEKYSTNIDDLNNQFMHLTNYSINKKNDSYKQNNDESSLDGNKWTLKVFLNYISENRKDVCLKKLSERISDLILKTVISCQFPVNRTIHKYQNFKYNNFELLGFDIMLDSNFKPWILEVNVSPSLRSESSVDHSVKSQLIKDTLNIVGYRLPLRYSEDLLNYTLSDLEEKKHNTFYQEFMIQSEKLSEDQDELNAFDFNLTDNLLPDDIRQLCLAEDELSRSGSFIRLFPSKYSETYLQYFMLTSYRNHLLVEWERKYGDRRQEAVAYLQQLCAQKLNLAGNRGKSREDLSVISDNESC